MTTEEEVLKNLEMSVVLGDAEKATKAAKRGIEIGVDPAKAISEGLAKGMAVVGEKYENSEYYLPEVVLAAGAMYAGLNVLKPHIKVESTKKPGKLVLGTIEGDVHDIGKNLVKIMYIGAGWEVYDLGKDVPLMTFVNKAKEVKANIVAASALMTTSMMQMKDLIQLFKQENIREKVGIIVGGAPVSQEFANEISANGFAPDAVKAVKIGEKILLDKKTSDKWE
jgi:corrinoid protein of di/trimethylamine methyltransferase